MKGSSTKPRVFISYSWTSPQHEQWVLDLAERLSSDGIVVILDKWDLKEGQDKHKFMEQMVNDPDIKKVLVICERGYQTKADDRKGGVGTETQLISKEVYENTGQEKFIPVVREYGSDGKPCIPHYMASRIYIDLSSDDRFEENYQKLVRNLYDKPALKRPTLGTPPVYITEEDPVILKTSHKVAEIKHALANGKPSAKGLIADYLEAFVLALEDFRISGGTAPDFDEKVVTTLEKMLPLKDDFVDFAFTVFKYQENVDIESLHDFFERLIPFFYPTANVFTRVDCDNYKFFIYELTLNFMAVLMKLKKYKEAGSLIHAQYFYTRPTSSQIMHSGIEAFNQYAASLDEIRNRRLNLHRTSVTADMLRAHSTRPDLKFDEVMQTDMLLYYLTELAGVDFPWFPRTSVYNSRGASVEIFDKMVSRQQFERVKALFDVTSIKELEAKVTEYIERVSREQHRRFDTWNFEVRPLQTVIDPTKIGIVK